MREKESRINKLRRTAKNGTIVRVGEKTKEVKTEGVRRLAAEIRIQS